MPSVSVLRSLLRLRGGFGLLAALLAGCSGGGQGAAGSASGGSAGAATIGGASGSSMGGMGLGGGGALGGAGGNGGATSGGGTGGNGEGGSLSMGGVGAMGGAAAGGTAAVGGAAAGGNGAMGGSGSGGGGSMGGNGGSGGELPDDVPPGYTLVFEESFAEPASIERLLIANEQEWAHSAAGYVEFTAASYAPPFRSPFSLAVVKGLSASSFVLEVELLQTSVGEGHRDMIIAWNMLSPSEFYYAHISETHDDVAHHLHLVNNADRAPITETFTPGFDWGTDVWRTLRVIRDASTGTMQVYDVDNAELVLSATDSTFTTGFFGVGSFDNTGRVRNLRIWSSDATQTSIPFSF